MAAPASKNIADLNGKWVMNKNLSDSTNAGLALQGISFLTRKAIGLATVTLQVKQFIGPATPPASDKDEVTRIEIEQSTTGGIKGTTENRCLDGTLRGHSDWLFGKVEGRTTWVSAEELVGAVATEHGEYLAKNWIEGESETKGPGNASHVLSFVKSLDSDWTAVQVWGFQMIGGERRYTRSVIIAKGNKKSEFRLVYDFVSG